VAHGDVAVADLPTNASSSRRLTPPAGIANTRTSSGVWKSYSRKRAIDAARRASRTLSGIVEVDAAVIIAFEVPPDADADFIAAWEHTRDRLVTIPLSGMTLHRALREDVDFRFVAVAQVDDRRAWEEAISDPLPFISHAGVYEVVREHGQPDVTGGVVLINPFEVPPDADEPFLTGWDGARPVLAQQQGYLGIRLHRSLALTDFRFVNIARWSSPLMFARALKRPEFTDAVAAMPFLSHPALYTPA
jgi:heme-degrading monooxygenase HmoA